MVGPVCNVIKKESFVCVVFLFKIMWLPLQNILQSMFEVDVILLPPNQTTQGVEYEPVFFMIFIPLEKYLGTSYILIVFPKM